MNCAPKKRMSFRDHCERNSLLLEYARTHLELCQYLLITMQLHYASSFVPWFKWAGQLQSVSHQMEELSQSLVTMGQRNGPATDGRLLTSREAYTIYLNYLGKKNESDTVTPATIQEPGDR